MIVVSRIESPDRVLVESPIPVEGPNSLPVSAPTWIGYGKHLSAPSVEDPTAGADKQNLDTTIAAPMRRPTHS